MSAILVYNGQYTWQGFGDRQGYKWSSYCLLTIFLVEQTPIVIVKDQPESGSSITNSVENIASLICRDFNLNPLNGSGLVWFECYPDYEHQGKIIPGISTVTFTITGNPNPQGHLQFPGCRFLFSEPMWRPLNEQSTQLLEALQNQTPSPSVKRGRRL